MKPFLKWTAIVLVVFACLIFTATIILYGWSSHRLGTIYDIAPATVLVNFDEPTIDRGRHILNIRGCRDCHGEDLGGAVFIDEPVLGRLVGTNLTPGAGGVGQAYDDADWVRAIRHGVGPDGKPLIFMPSYEYFPLDDDDLGSLIAYLKSLEPIDRELPGSRVGPLGRALFLAGELPLLSAEMIDHAATVPKAPSVGPTAEYGAYLATGCVGCHGMGYSGGKIPGTPPDWPAAANITPHETGIGNWTYEQYEILMRTGVRPDGREVDPQFMPWPVTNHMTDDELQAIWAYLQSLPPKEAGNR